MVYLSLYLLQFKCKTLTFFGFKKGQRRNPHKLDKHVNVYWHKKDTDWRVTTDEWGLWPGGIKSECVICVWIIRYTNRHTKRDTTGNTNWHFVCLSPDDRRQTTARPERHRERERRAWEPLGFAVQTLALRHRVGDPKSHNVVIECWGNSVGSTSLKRCVAHKYLGGLSVLQIR